MLTMVKVSVSITIVKTPFKTALATTTVTVVEAAWETMMLRLRQLVLRRRVEAVVGSWIWEVWIDSWGSLVANGFSTRGVTKEPGGVVGLLHGVRSGRGGRVSRGG